MTEEPANTPVPDEVAAIRAENSRAHRAAQTTINLLWALVASLLVVLFLVLVVVRPDPVPGPNSEPLDYAEFASQVQDEVVNDLAVPALPTGWEANDASFDFDHGVSHWYIGFITKKQQFIALNQGDAVDADWVDDLLDNAKPTGTRVVDELRWTVYDRRDLKDPGNFAYALVTKNMGSTYVLYGTAIDSEFDTLVTALELG